MITVHTIVRNEEQWVWYALMSVLPHVKKVLVYDTGSTDKTVEIIKSIKSDKVRLSQLGKVSPQRLVELRNEQLKKTETEFFLLLDGDEVWPESAVKELVDKSKTGPKSVTAFVSNCLMPVGDLFHIQPETAGRYELQGKRGHFNIRLYRKRTDYRWTGIYPDEAFTDKKNVPVQKKNDELVWLIKPYWHLSLMHRTSSFSHKLKKLEIGERHTNRMPEVFFTQRPHMVPSPWIHFSPAEQHKATALNPLYKLKRHM